MTDPEFDRDRPAKTKSIAYFVTDHGYGHATRSAAVMAAIAKVNPQVCFEIFTTAPRWLFEDPPHLRFNYHKFKSDIGLIQSSPFKIDLAATVAELDNFLPFDPKIINQIAADLLDLNCRLVISDIAPIGISIANQAGLPAALVENFTWDWIYAGYFNSHPALVRHSEYLKTVYSSAGIHIQTEPICRIAPSARKTPPVCRPVSEKRDRIRAALGISQSVAMVLVSMGGLANPTSFAQALPEKEDVVFVVPGGDQVMRREHTIFLPQRLRFPHPDLVNAADAVIGKVGYSTLAEVYQAGVAFGYLAREDFRESAVLVDFIKRQIPSVALDAGSFATGDWHAELSALLAHSRVGRDTINGARQVAQYLSEYI